MAIGLSKWFKATFLGIEEKFEFDVYKSNQKQTVRARDEDGKYIGDDKSTPNVNEAYTTVNVRKDNLKPAQKRRLKRRGIK
jgi:hypothetical protein